MSDPVLITHYRKFQTPLRLKALIDGDPQDLSGKTVFAGIESTKGTASNSSCFRKFAVTGHGTHGTLSATIPNTGINFTGAAVMRIFSSGPRQLLGSPIPVAVKELSANWV